MEILDGGREFAADGAAQASRLQQHHRLVDALQQVVVKADLTEFVYEDGGVAECRIRQQALQQRGLARAQEARDQIDGSEISHWPPRGARLARDRADRTAGR